MGSRSGGGFVAGEEDRAACDFGLGLNAGGEGFPASAAASGVASSVQGSFDPSGFKSWVSCSGGGILMGFGGGSQTRPFTASQRQEFERQSIIFKYMAASIPVPPELLIPMNSKFPSQPSYQSNDNGGKSAMESKYGGVNRDSEPWRCRRTDGKKWRCSKDVAPDQKYCERHSHKGRPSRSRKHVESLSSSSSISVARMSNSNVTLMPSSTSSAAILPQHCPNPPQYADPRFPDWFTKREAAVHHDAPFYPQTQLHRMPDSLSPHSHSLSGGGFMRNHPNDPSHPPLPRQFLDAWSIGEKSGGIGEITTKPAVSTSSLLTLSMAGGGIGIDDSNEFDTGREREGERYAWMGASGPGGPLAEALCLGMVGTGGGRGGARGSSGHGHGESSQGLGFMK